MAEYIDRNTFIAKKREWYCQNCDRRKNSKGKLVYEIGDAPCRACDIGDILDAVEDYHVADVVERKKGKWEEVEVTWLADIEDQPDAIASMFCPECKHFANHVYHNGSPTNGMNFCPNCGAKMEG